MGKAEIWNFSTCLQLDISQVSAVIFHILQAMHVETQNSKNVLLGERI